MENQSIKSTDWLPASKLCKVIGVTDSVLRNGYARGYKVSGMTIERRESNDPALAARYLYRATRQSLLERAKTQPATQAEINEAARRWPRLPLRIIEDEAPAEGVSRDDLKIEALRSMLDLAKSRMESLSADNERLKSENDRLYGILKCITNAIGGRR